MYLQFFFIFFFVIIKVYSQAKENCRRNFAYNCAEGWIKLATSNECAAPLSYTGPCPRLLQIEQKTKKKKLLEQECNIHWPCFISCEKNYSAQCPFAWIPIDEKMCFPSAIYNGDCLLPHDFSNMTIQQKEIWGNKCDATWPCKETCKKDYMKSCPQGWIKDENGLCTAPKYYSGPCLPKASLISMDIEMKMAFEALCEIDFPCIKKCEIDMEETCPKQWILQSDESGKGISCIPPDNYTGNCDRNTLLLNLNVESRNQKAFECNVEWACIETDSINYDELCPEGWIQDQKYCVAPQDYTGPCPQKKIFISFSKELKKEYAEICNIKWPLINDKKLEKPIKALKIGSLSSGPVDHTTGEVIAEV